MPPVTKVYKLYCTAYKSKEKYPFVHIVLQQIPTVFLSWHLLDFESSFEGLGRCWIKELQITDVINISWPGLNG